MANSADLDPDQKATDRDLHCLQKQGVSGFSRTRVKLFIQKNKHFFLFLLRVYKGAYQDVLLAK